MVRLKRFGLGKPEVRDLRQDFAFARDSVRHDDFESRDAIRSDKKESVAEIKNFANLAALQFLNSGQFELEHCVISHRGNMRTGENRAKRKVELVSSPVAAHFPARADSITRDGAFGGPVADFFDLFG